VITREEGIRDEITVQCELAAATTSAWDSLAPRLRKDLADNPNGTRPAVATPRRS
jgi:hypothetical protein